MLDSVNQDMDAEVDQEITLGNKYPLGYDSGLDYLDNRPNVEPYRNIYHLTLPAKLKVFVFMFVIIVVPAFVAFVTCYIRDRRKQKAHERHVAAILSESPDPSLPYSVRLSRPVPGSDTEPESVPEKNERRRSSRKVSFADGKSDHDGRPSTFSRSKSFSPSLEDVDDDVFIEDKETKNDKYKRKNGKRKKLKHHL